MEKLLLLLSCFLFLFAYLEQKVRPDFAFALAQTLNNPLDVVKNWCLDFSRDSRVFFEGLEKAMAGLRDDLKNYMNTINEQAKENGKVDETTKSEVKNLVEKLRERDEKEAKMQQQLDQLATDAKKFQGVASGPGKSFSEALAEHLLKNKEQINSIKEHRLGQFMIPLEEKAAADMSSATNLKGTLFVTPQQVGGLITPFPYNQQHIRDFLTVGVATSNTIRYMRDNGNVGGGKAAIVPEGGLKPQLDREFEILSAEARKIAAHFRVPEEMLDDVAYLATYLGQIGIEEVKKEEDLQLLNGDGTGNNMLGINTAANPFTRLDGIGQVASAHELDVISAAIALLRARGIEPNLGIVSAGTYAGLRLKKKADGSYLFPELSFGGQAVIDGVPLRSNANITASEFTVGDFRSGAALYDKMEANVRFYDQDRDNAIKNLVTIVIEERIMMPIYKPYAFINDTFANAKTLLGAA